MHQFGCSRRYRSEKDEDRSVSWLGSIHETLHSTNPNAALHPSRLQDAIEYVNADVISPKQLKYILSILGKRVYKQPMLKLQLFSLL